MLPNYSFTLLQPKSTMQIKKIELCFIVILTLLVACQNNTEPKPENEPKQATKVEDTPSAKNTIDWAGTYFGILPCASCSGVNTLITLNKDDTFEKTTELLDSNEEEKIVKGRVLWTEDNSIITVECNYLVSENQLILLDSENKPVIGKSAKQYLLEKIDLTPKTTANSHSIQQKFEGDDKKEYNIVFITSTGVPIVFIESADIKKVLLQKEAWAQGAIYEANKVSLKMQGDKGTLQLGDKKVTLTLAKN